METEGLVVHVAERVASFLGHSAVHLQFLIAWKYLGTRLHSAVYNHNGSGQVVHVVKRVASFPTVHEHNESRVVVHVVKRVASFPGPLDRLSVFAYCK